MLQKIKIIKVKIKKNLIKLRKNVWYDFTFLKKDTILFK